MLDELWAPHKDEGLYEACVTGLVKRHDAKLLAISTAAAQFDSPLGRLRARALAQPYVKRKGAVLEARGDIPWLEWSLPEDASPDDMRAVKACNPASHITAADLRRQRSAVQDGAFQQFHACRWGVGEGSWLPAGAWQACVGEPEFTEAKTCGWASTSADNAPAPPSYGSTPPDTSAAGSAWATTPSSKPPTASAPSAGNTPSANSSTTHGAPASSPRNSSAKASPPCSSTRTTSAWCRPASGSTRQSSSSASPCPTTPCSPAIQRTRLQSTPAAGWRIAKPDDRAHIDAIIALAMAVERMEHKPVPVELLGWL